MKVTSSALNKPLEWDLTSSKTTVYHKINIIRITTDDSGAKWEYEEEQSTFEEFSNSLYGKQLAKLNSLNGMCSGAIYSGLDIGGKHYSFTQTAQGNIKGMLIEIQGGKTTFLYSADNEPLTAYTAAQITAIAQVMGEWINVNTAYYEQLKVWIERETDETILDGIRYGSMLPKDLMQSLAVKLASVGINVTKYATALSA